jgi:Cdc6-like AAA superfamily ATPase
MGRQFNPFVYGAPLPHTYFIGREGIINNCYNRLAGPVRTSIAISGEHGVGKTSLLNYLIYVAQEEGWGQPYTHNLFIRLDCQEISQFTPTRFWQHVLRMLIQIEDDPLLHEQIELRLAKSELDATHLQPLLSWLGQHGLSLTLLLDSFASVVKAHKTAPALTSDFLSSLRALTSLPDNALTLLTATRDPLNILCAEIVKDYPGSYFYNNFAFESLTPFTSAEIDDLLSRALSETGIEFDLSDRDLLHRLAGTHPALFQMAAYHLFESRRHGPLTDQVYKQVIEDFERVARNYFSLFWEESSSLERTLFILVILNYLPAQSGLQPDMKNEEIQHLLQRHERDLMH